MSEHTRHHRPSKLLAILVLSVVAGLLVAVMALPVIGSIGVSAKASADFFNNLPTELTQPPLAERSVILDRNGDRIATLHGSEDRVMVPFSDIPVTMRHAIVAIEDRRFYTHHGVDYRGIIRAAVTNQESGSVTQGGSTLTQQYVKNVLIESATTKAQLKDARDRSVKRKLREARYALALERKFTKDQILAKYLNIANFGDGAYGVEAAAQHYFGIHAKQLNVVQAALLAGIVNSPTAYDPKLHPKAALARRQLVLDQMAVAKYLTPVQAKYAKTFPLSLTKSYVQTSDGCDLAGSAAFFCSYVRDQLLTDPAFGATAEARQRRLFEGGLVIKTSLDPKVQADAQSAVDTIIPPGGRVGTAAVVMKPGTGEVLAMAVNRVYGDTTDHLPVYGVDQKTGKVIQSADRVHTKFNYATAPAFQAGSTFKMFTISAALEKGLSTSTSFNSPNCIFVTGFDNSPPLFGNPPYKGQCPATDAPGQVAPPGAAFVNAADGEAFSALAMPQATSGSVNTYFVQLEKKVGIPAVREMAVRLGVRAPAVNTTAANNIASFTLGTPEVSPLDMATAYGTIAAHGLRCYPKPVIGITSGDGKTVSYTGPGKCKQVLKAGIADTVTSLLQGVIASGTAQANGQIGRPAAGKTGTTDEHYDAWFVGFIPQLVTAVWVGDARSPTTYPLQIGSTTPDGVVTGGVPTWYPGNAVFGGDLPTMIWASAMKTASADLPVVNFPPPDPQVVQGKTTAVPFVGGMTVEAATAILAFAGFSPTDGGSSPSSYPYGTVAFTSPGGGFNAPQGSTVSIFTSSGPAPVYVPPVVPKVTPAAPTTAPTVPKGKPTTPVVKQKVKPTRPAH